MKVLLKANNKDVEILESSSTLNENDDFIQKLRVNVEIPLSALEELFVVFESDDKADATHKLPFIKVGEGYTVDIPDNVINTGGIWNIQLFRRRYSSTNVYYTETASNVFFMSIGEGVKNGSGEKVTFAQIQTMYHAIEAFLEDNGQDTGNLNERVAAIVKEQTKGLQPKEDESLKTNSKKVAEAINEVKGSIPFVPSWAQEQEKPKYSYTEITDRPFLLQVGETTGTAYDGAKGKKNAADIEALKIGKQDALAFDGTYNANENKVATVKTVTDKIASILANAPEAFDTLEEIASWINNHPQDVAALNAAIQSNKTGIATNAQAIINALAESKKYADEKAVGNLVATVEGQNLVLTLKDENGTIIATTTVLLPIPESGSAGEKGEKGDKGERGTGILKVTTAPASYTTATAGKNPIKRMSLSTIKKEASVDEVLVGDCVSYSYYLYHIYYVDATYAYMDTYQSIRGATGATGSAGANGKDGADGYTPIKGIDYFTEADKAEIVQMVIDSLGGNPVFGYVDENNNIILTGNLAEGTYFAKYETDDSTIDIGEFVLGQPIPTTRLPAEYQEVEWVQIIDGENVGNNCSVHTSVKWNEVNKIVAKVQNINSTNANDMFFATWVSATSKVSPFIETSTGTSNYMLNMSSGLTGYSVSPNNIVATDLNANEYTITFTSTSTGDICFGSWTDATYSHPHKWYYVELYNNDTLVAKFIPCYRKADNVNGFYDLVGGAFYIDSDPSCSFKHRGNDVSNGGDEPDAPIEPDASNLFTYESSSLNCRLGSDGTIRTGCNGVVVSDFIDITNVNKLRLSGNLVFNSTISDYGKYHAYDADGNNIQDLASFFEGFSGSFDVDISNFKSRFPNVAKMRFAFAISESTAITETDVTNANISITAIE